MARQPFGRAAHQITDYPPWPFDADTFRLAGGAGRGMLYNTLSCILTVKGLI